MMLAVFSVFFFCFVGGWSFTTVASDTKSENLGVYYYGNVSRPFSYLRAMITMPSGPLPELDNQFLFYYFGLAKKGLSANGMVVFCGYKDGCWNGSIQPGFSFYSELSTASGRLAGGEKISIQPGESAEVTIIQDNTFLSVNITKISDGLDSYFDIYGANDGGLIDIIAGVDLQYQSNQTDICVDYNKQPYIISDIIAVESGLVVNSIDFKRDANETNSCGGTINVGSQGKTLNITGSK